MSRAWCRWCGAEIRWAKTTNDKNIPLDPCPTPARKTRQPNLRRSA